MQPVEQFDEALGDSMTPQSENTPREGEKAAIVDLEAKTSGKNVLIRIICVKQKGYIPKIVAEIEKLHLTIDDFKASSFGNNLLTMTISAQRDKVCTMEQAVEHLRQLQERVNTLEEQANNTSVVFRPQTCEEAAIVKLEAKAEGKNVLIRIECVKQKDYVPKIATEIEKFHLTIDSFNALPFGNNLWMMTILAQMDDESYMTKSDLLANLQRDMFEK